MTTTATTFSPLTGSCVCKTVSYALTAAPLVTQCCHCTLCQRESGSAFKTNMIIESYNLQITSPTKPNRKEITSPAFESGGTYLLADCPKCLAAVYARYDPSSSLTFIGAGTLDEASKKRVQPDIHVFTASKVQWVNLKSEEERGVKMCPGFYKKEEVWPEESLRRRQILQEWDDKNKQTEASQQVATSIS